MKRSVAVLHSSQQQSTTSTTFPQKQASSYHRINPIPPVPDHWRARGLPGARQEFDRVLEKARASASQRLATELARDEQVHLEKQGLLAGDGDDLQAMGESIKKSN